ncbi:MAG: ABC transporter permease [Steroidobacteraceae bacterium]
MFKHYLQTALRNLWRFKYSTLANVLCLAFGLSCFLLAYAVFAYFMSMESGFKNADRIYAVSTLSSSGDGVRLVEGPNSPRVLAKYLQLDEPELMVSSAQGNDRVGVRVGEGESFTLAAMVADKQFLSIFDIPVLRGDRFAAFVQQDSVMLGGQTALKLFGTLDVVGKTLVLEDTQQVTVAGVLGELPQPTHLGKFGGSMPGNSKEELQILLPWAVYDRLMLAKDPSYAQKLISEEWLSLRSMTYVLLPDNGSIDKRELQSRLTALEKRRSPLGRASKQANFRVMPVSSVFYSTMGMSWRQLGVPMFALLLICGTLVLFVAIINYVNLATAQSVVRSREMGLRRLLGATRMSVVAQCAGESLLVSAAALVLAVAVLKVLISSPLAKVQMQMNIELLSGWRMGLTLLGLVLLVGCLSAAYPALVLSRAAPANAVRAQSMNRGRSWLARCLVGVQFMMAGLMLVFIFVINIQHRELRETILSRLEDPVVSLNLTTRDTKVSAITFSTELRRHPEIKAVSAMSGPLFTISPSMMVIQKDSKEGSPRHSVVLNTVFTDYFSVMDVPLLAGRAVDMQHPDVYRWDDKPLTTKLLTTKLEDTAITNVVVDRDFVRLMGWRAPEQAIDSLIYSNRIGLLRMRIVGVVENHVMQAMGRSGEASVFVLGDEATWGNFAIVRVDKKQLAAGLQAIDGVWNKLAPGALVSRVFADEQYERSSSMFMMLFAVLSLLAVLAFAIAIMGMVGMATHTISRRTHEIGIRKILGSNGVGIFKLLLQEFAKPIVISNLLAWPVAFVICRLYLSLFPGRVTLTLWPFISGLVITVFIAWLSVSVQTLRAARMKPAEVLRYE